MLEDNIVVETKRTIARTSGPRSSSEGKGNRSRCERDGDDECGGSALICTSGHRGVVGQNRSTLEEPEIGQQQREDKIHYLAFTTSTDHPVALGFRAATPAHG